MKNEKHHQAACDDSGRSSLVAIGHITWKQHWCHCDTKLHLITPLCYGFKPPPSKCRVGFISILVRGIPTLAWFTSRLLVHMQFLYMFVGQTQYSGFFVACRPFIGVYLEIRYKIPDFMISFPSQIAINQGSITHVQTQPKSYINTAIPFQSHESFGIYRYQYNIMVQYGYIMVQSICPLDSHQIPSHHYLPIIRSVLYPETRPFSMRTPTPGRSSAPPQERQKKVLESIRSAASGMGDFEADGGAGKIQRPKMEV